MAKSIKVSKSKGKSKSASIDKRVNVKSKKKVKGLKSKEDTGAKVLNHEEHKRYEVLSIELKLFKSLMGNEEQNLRNLKLELLLMQNKLNSQQSMVNRSHNEYKNKAAQYSNFIKEIIAKYGFDVGSVVGIDTRTGEISSATQQEREKINN